MSRKRHQVDQAATDAAGFLDRGGKRPKCRSYVTHTGKVFLFGVDKSLLRMRCFIRDKFSCTECGNRWEAGGDDELEMHHVIPLGKGGDDRLENVTMLCKWNCHKGKHVSVRWGPKNDVRLLDRSLDA